MENLSPLGFKVATGMRKECFDLLLQKLGPQMGVTAGDAASAEAAATHLKLVLLFMRNGGRTAFTALAAWQDMTMLWSSMNKVREAMHASGVGMARANLADSGQAFGCWALAKS
ncbi:hypothetical protein FNF29_02489 [Cafeteria roenbergensis]|uniref:Uncharacterized protein n=1 Tax=Cafeteria roenbergensis TaxID=33653 RepID=A0A5A8CNE5_CAFRO|nr:hypothetical protein FNF29_02489 [Cafeteria roenbergensis]|eukprot:KAA0154269.1 hypothetical protein FNF29_02489 [Cafeteria roenbergensis]